jgi:ABC-type transport system involved in multi-copper enzyme maturation permease subunit
MRELRQSARLQRTPVILAVVTAMMTLLSASIGGVASVSAAPATVGVALFQTFFSLAFFGVTWLGPAVAASTIASERSGRTWEALTLTGLGPTVIARGKFAASLTYVCLYLVMLAPVGALPFLFGGVTATEVIVAFLALIVFAVLSVAFGLSISSKLASSATAIVVTLLVAVPLSLVGYLTLGVGLSFGAHELWPAVDRGLPVWLPTAYARADFGVPYVAFLVIAPLVLIALPAWYLYEVTVANMSGASDDQSSGLRRWFSVSCPVLAIASSVPAFLVSTGQWVAMAWAMSAVFSMIVFGAFGFVSEPLGPSRRVMVHWDRANVGRVRRFMGPGLLRACALLLGLGLVCLVAQGAAGMLLEITAGGTGAHDDALRLVAFGGYLAAFSTFVVGFAAVTRAYSRAATLPRLLLLAALFLVAIGPWIAMAIAGIVASGTQSDTAIAIAAPSPTYVLRMVSAFDATETRRDLVLTAGSVCAVGWAALGVGLLAVAASRARRVVADHAAALQHLEETLQAEEIPVGEAGAE